MTTPVSRRAFLKGASLLGGGLILGVDIFCQKVTNEKLQTNDATFQPNIWLKIDKQNVITVIVAKSEMGQGAFTGLAMVVAEELSADWQNVRVERALTHPDKYGSESTGGSTSIRTLYSIMRKAGASARAMLISAAAKQWGVSMQECTAEQGAVLHTATGKKLSYGELAESAAQLPVPSDAELKDASKFSIMRKKAHRVDTPSKVDGSAIFGMDVRVPGMLYAAIARPPAFGATVESFDASKAKSLPGVKNIIREGDILAVIAETTWSAFKGRDALSVTWSKSEYDNQSTQTLWKQFEEKAKNEGDIEQSAGDAEKAYREAAKKIEAVYYTPFAHHVTMEPMNCTVHVKGDTCEIWAPSQTPQDAQRSAANILGISVNDVTFHVTLLGGGFGRRLETDYVTEAVQVAKHVNAPVKIVWTREEDMKHGFYRPMQYTKVRAGLDSSGNPVAWLYRIVGPEGKGLLTHASKTPYDIPNIRLDAQALDTGIPTGAWRSVGASQNGFVIESFIDELAHAGGKDPYEYRRGLLTKSNRLKRALELAAEKSGWGTPLPKGKGRGIACVSGFGSHVAEVAEVTVSERGEIHVDRVVVAVDCGPYVNPDGINAQMDSAIAFGLSAMLKDEITIEKGGVAQSNFDDYRMVMIDDMPKVEVHILESDEMIGGIGEPGVPPIAPAVANAVFAATGKRIRKLPVQL